MTEAAAYTLVTGASSGIGRAAAVRLSAGRKLILHGRSEARLNETRGMCCHPNHHVVWSFDLKSVDQVEASLTLLLAEDGRAVEAFVHCAGMVTVLPSRSTDYQSALETMNVNFFAAAEIVRLLLKKKNQRRQAALRGSLHFQHLQPIRGTRAYSLLRQ